MENASLPDDADFLAAAAVAALAIALTAAKKIDGDEMLSAWIREIEELPSWRHDADAWTRGLWSINEKYKLPDTAELQRRTIEQSLFNRVRQCSLDAISSTDQRARHFHLSMASIAAGSLLSIAVGAKSQADMDAAMEAARSVLGKQAADGHHKDNRADKRAVFDWLDINREQHKSLESCADAIVAEHLVSAARKTIRTWATEWNKLQAKAG